MTHPRSPIRAALVAAVVSVPGVGSNVKATRLETQDTDKLPASTILTMHETVSRDTMKTYSRVTKYQVTATIKPGDDPDQDLDDVGILIEAAVAESASNGALKPLIVKADLTETRFEFRTTNASGQALTRPIARIGLIYDITYRTTLAGSAT